MGIPNCAVRRTLGHINAARTCHEGEPFVECCDPTRQTNPIPSSINRPIADEQPGPVRYTYQPSLETFINLSSAYTSIDPHHHIILWHESGKLVWLTITGKSTLIWVPTTLKEIKEEMLGSRIHIQIPGINTTRQAIRHVTPVRKCSKLT